MTTWSLAFPAVPAERAERYRAAGLWSSSTITGIVREAAAGVPGKLAVVDQSRALDYAGLWRRCSAVAGRLRREGIAAGQTVVLCLPNSVTWLECFLGLVQCGALPVMATESLRARELIRIIEASHADHVVTAVADGRSAALHRAVHDAIGLLPADAPAPVVHEVRVSDGLTADATDADSGEALHQVLLGDPALVQLGGARCAACLLIGRTHEDYLCSVELSNRRCGIGADTVMLIGIPASHNYAMASPGVLGVLMAHGTVVFAPDPSPSTCTPLVHAHGCTHVPLVPSLLGVWSEAAGRDPELLRSLRTVWVGGAPLDLDLAATAQTMLGAHVQEVFGMAEGLVAYSPLELDRVLEPRAHRLVPLSEQDEIRLSRVVASDGTEGHELLSRGPYTVPSFIGDPPQAAGVFDSAGWYHSGDLVEVERAADSAGPLEFRVVGRCKAQINRAGEKIFPGYVETLLEEHPQVRRALVEGVADPVLGQAIKATVHVRPDEEGGRLRPLALRRYLHGKSVAGHCVPDAFDLVRDEDQVPSGEE